jgi:multiple sugar transport system ATP-binding protein
VVDVVEPMGSEIYLYMKAGKVDLVVRVPSYVKAEAGKRMELVFNLERMHVFDKESRESLLKSVVRTSLPAPTPTS